MPKETPKETLEQLAAQLLTMQEAAQWIESTLLEDYGLLRGPKSETLKTAYGKGRLKAVLKGGVLLTGQAELREYMRHFDPKNKTENRPVKRRYKKKIPEAQEVNGAIII